MQGTLPSSSSRLGRSAPLVNGAPTHVPSQCRRHAVIVRSSDKSIETRHQQLLREIQERRRSQEALLEKLNKLSSQTATINAAAVPSPQPHPRLVAPDLEPDFPETQPVHDEAALTAQPAGPAAPEPLAGPNVMKVVMVGSECAPWSKTGGLGDVMGALPKALARRGHRVMVVAPRYGQYAHVEFTGVRRQISMFGGMQEIGYFHSFIDGVDYVFIDHPTFHNLGTDIYGGGRLALMFRCALLSKAALEAVWHVPCGGVPYGDDNCVFIANDWHTALLPVYLQAHYRAYNQMTYARCLFVIHNMAHQGRAPFDEIHHLEFSDAIKEQFRMYDPVGGEHMNILKVGLETCHRIVAVSTGYAWECQTQDGGWGLHNVVGQHKWKLKGIVNGIDYSEWSPEQDVFLQTDGYVKYSMETLKAGKAACKAALQRELGLPVDANIPLYGFIGRLDYQKGVDLIRDNYDWLMGEQAQLVFLGSGRPELEQSLRDMESRSRSQCRGWVGFSVQMAHRITAGCDMLLMPSRFEPCGLNQLYAMAYGTVPIVHAVGGLRDTVQEFNAEHKIGTGWTFPRAEANPLREAISHSLHTFKHNRESFRELQLRGMNQDLSWDNAAQLYEDVLVEAKYQW